jgi:hypothetical protein
VHYVREPEPDHLARHQFDQATALVLGEIAGEAVDGDVVRASGFG